MPYAKFDAFPASSGTPRSVSLATPNTTTAANGIVGVKPVSGLLTVLTQDALVAFNCAADTDAATAMTDGNAAGNNQAMIVPAGTVIELRNIDPTTTWIGGFTTSGGSFSFMGF
jgi:hypothetical protein